MTNFKIFIRIVITVLLIAVLCSYFGQILLKIIYFSELKYFIYVLPIVLIFTRLSYKYFKIENIGMKYLIENSQKDSKKIKWSFPMLLTINTLLAHLSGASVGREGVAVQLGGAIGINMTSKSFSREQKIFFLKLGMMCGFSALFQTWLTAVFFILEITYRKIKITRKNIIKLVLYFICSFVSAKLSFFLGLEKFSIDIKFYSTPLYFIDYFKLIFCLLVAIIIGISFVVVQRKLKIIIKKYYLLTYFLLLLFIVVSVLTNFKYNSLGINLIYSSFENIENIRNYDFIFKLLLTALCTAIGFSGGEVTPLFAIGASLGVVLSGILGLPTLLIAAICYTLVFSSSTRTVITPIFLFMEVFGLGGVSIILISSVFTYIINRKWSIYKD